MVDVYAKTLANLRNNNCLNDIWSNKIIVKTESKCPSEEYQELKDQCEELRKDISQLEDTSKEYSKKVENSKTKLKELLDEIEKCEKCRAEMDSKIKEKKDELDELPRKIKTKEEKRDNITKYLDEHNEEKEKLDADIREKRESSSKLKEDIGEKEKSLSELEEDIKKRQSYKEEIETKLKSTAEGMNDKLKETWKRLEELDERLKKWESNVDDIKKERSVILEKMKGYKDLLKDLDYKEYWEKDNVKDSPVQRIIHKVTHETEIKEHEFFALLCLIRKLMNEEGYPGKISFFGMFSKCSKLERVHFPNYINLDIVEDFSKMFYQLKNLKEVRFSSRSGVFVKMESMFEDCDNLETVELPKIGFQNVGNTLRTFKGCKKLTKVTNLGLSPDVAQEMFAGCSSIETLEFCNPADDSTDLYRIFYGCTNLSEVRVRYLCEGEWDKMPKEQDEESARERLDGDYVLGDLNDIDYKLMITKEGKCYRKCSMKISLGQHQS